MQKRQQQLKQRGGMNDASEDFFNDDFDNDDSLRDQQDGFQDLSLDFSVNVENMGFAKGKGGNQLIQNDDGFMQDKRGKGAKPVFNQQNIPSNLRSQNNTSDLMNKQNNMPQG